MSLIERAIGKLHAHQPTPPVSPLARDVSDSAPASGPARPPAAEDPAGVGEAAARSASSPIPSEEKRREAGADAPAAPLLEIPSHRLARQGFIVPGAEPVRALNEFRIIKRPLIYNVSERKKPPLTNARRIMVTSALPGEGKTFCALNLALSIADERDHAVLLVDADVARPSLPRILGVEPRAGLMDALQDPNLDVGALVSPTSVEKLSILMAGRPHGRATEMLASAAMSALLQQISARFPDRIVVFDSPPLLVTTEASALAVHMGQIVLVVESGRTDRNTVAAALATLEAAPGEISTLMNKASKRASGEFRPYGGYGYGYGYGAQA